MSENNTKKNIGWWLATVSIKHRWWVMLASIIAVISMASGAHLLKFSTDYRIFFSAGNPNLIAFENLQNTYTKADNVMFVIKPKDGDVFTPHTLKAIQEITEESWQLPYSTRVDSITNFQNTVSENDDLIVADLVEEDPSTYTPAEIETFKQTALNEPLLVNRLVSKNAETTGINVTVHLTGEDPLEGLRIATASRELEEKYKEKYPDITFAISGIAMMNYAFQEAGIIDMQTLVPIMYLLLFVAIAFFLRSFIATLITLSLGVLSIVAAMGAGGWFGFPLTPPSTMVPTIVLTLAVADSIHIFMGMFKALNKGMNRTDAIAESMRVNFQPVMLTSITTAIGFLALNFSDAPPFHHLGTMSAVGVIVAWLLSITFVPALMSFVKYEGRTERHFFDDMMVAFGEWVIAQRKKLLVFMTVTVIGLGITIPKLELNDEFVKYFDTTVDFRQDTDFLLNNLTGLYQVEYSLEAKNSGGISEPEYLENLDAFVGWLKQQPEVQHISSVLEIIKRLNKNMHGDDMAYYRIPDSRNMTAQYLLLYEMSLPYGLDLNDRINIDKSASRVTVTIHDMSTVQMREFKTRSENWLKENTPEHMHTVATSANLMFAFISKNNIDSMTKGNILALVIISGLIMISLRSFRIGLFSMVPNLAPAIMAFGLWSIFFHQINMAVAIVMSVSLGIIVDDTVHFLSKYQRGIKEQGLDAIGAVRYAFSSVGSALVITSLSLIAGFAIMTFSSFQINETFGTLTALTITCALIADFLLLPPLLIALDKRNRKDVK